MSESKNDKAGLVIDLHKAVKDGNIDLVQSLLENKEIDPNAKDEDGNTLLHTAAAHGHVNIAKLLIEKNADINMTNNGGWNACHVATGHNQINVLEFLINQPKAIIKKNANNGCNLLHIAAAHGHVDILKFLIDTTKIALNEKDGNNTILHLAVLGLHVPIITLLLKYTDIINLDAKNLNGKTAFDMAVERKHAKIINLLSSQINTSSSEEESLNILDSLAPPSKEEAAAKVVLGGENMNPDPVEKMNES